MAASRVLALLVAFLPLVMCSAQEVTWTSTGSRYAVGRLSLEASQFNEEGLAAIAGRIRAENAGKSFLHVTFRCRGYRNSALDVMISEESFGLWKSLYDERQGRSAPVARLVVLRDSAVLDARLQDGRVWRKPISGSDPLGLQSEKGECRIVFFDIAGARATVFVKCPVKPELDVGKSILSKLQERFPFFVIHVYLRNDAWFLTVPGYPIVPPFEESAPPTREEYQLSRTMLCSYVSSRECAAH
jgi:hypothetical protein